MANGERKEKEGDKALKVMHETVSDAEERGTKSASPAIPSLAHGERYIA